MATFGEAQNALAEKWNPNTLIFVQLIPMLYWKLSPTLY